MMRRGLVQHVFMTLSSNEQLDMEHSRKLTGFTLVELVISIAIMGLLTALLVPNIDRSLSKNNLAIDVDLFKAKLEETRLMAGSTQQLDQGTGFYGLYLPPGDNNYFTVVRLSSGSSLAFGAPCTVETAVIESQPGFSGENICLIERISLGRGVTLSNTGGDRLIIYKAPTQILGEAKRAGSSWEAGTPDFNWGGTLQLKTNTKTATVVLESYTGKVSVTYS